MEKATFLEYRSVRELVKLAVRCVTVSSFRRNNRLHSRLSLSVLILCDHKTPKLDMDEV